jgi:hypothetical protein
MKKPLFWFLAVAMTLASAVYQRMTGPTHPARVTAVVEGRTMSFRLPRSAETKADAAVELKVPAPAEGYLEYMRYKTDEPWVRESLSRKNGTLVGFLPRQPAAGKLVYKVHIVAGSRDMELNEGKPLVIRFKDPVPFWLLIVHVIVMFSGMLFGTAAGLAALDKTRSPGRFVFWAVALVFVGGFILGPLVQKYAFGMFWSGFPVGTDLTDNKTLFLFLLWVLALVATRKGKPARPVVIAAAAATLVIYLIPHSVFGSELRSVKLK